MAEQSGERIDELKRIMQELIYLEWSTGEYANDDLDPDEEKKVICESLINYWCDSNRAKMTSPGKTPSDFHVTVYATTDLYWTVFHTCLCLFNEDEDTESFEEIFPNAFQHFEEIFQAHLDCSGQTLGGLFYNNSFQQFCALFGSDRVLEVVKSKVLAAVQNNKITLQELVLEIATFAGGNEVSPDALYLLIHLDPVLALLSRGNETGNTMQAPLGALAISEDGDQD